MNPYSVQKWYQIDTKARAGIRKRLAKRKMWFSEALQQTQLCQDSLILQGSGSRSTANEEALEAHSVPAQA
jgi:hypothetical protein